MLIIIIVVKKIKIKKIFINIPNHQGKRINLQNIGNKNNENIYKQYLLNKKIGNQPNKFIQINRNIYNTSNNSNNHYNIKINYNNYKQKNIQNNTIFNLSNSSNITSKGISPNNKNKINSKIVKNLINNNESNINERNNSKYLDNNNNIFLKWSNSPRNYKNFNNNNIIINNNANINYQINNKNFDKYYVNINGEKKKIIFDNYKDKRDKNNIRQFNKIKNGISPDKMNEISKKNNNLINNKGDIKKRCFIKNIDINLKKNMSRGFRSPLVKRNIDNFSKKNDKTEISNIFDKEINIKNKLLTNNYFSDKRFDNFKGNNNSERNKYYFLSDSSQNYGL